MIGAVLYREEHFNEAVRDLRTAAETFGTVGSSYWTSLFFSTPIVPFTDVCVKLAKNDRLMTLATRVRKASL